jgi:hypothetical protein
MPETLYPSGLGIKKAPQNVELLKSGRQDSNLRPPGPKPGALPACATSRFVHRSFSVGGLLIADCSSPPAPRLRWMRAVREGFEPSVQFNPYGSLANYWFEPLTHLTVPLLFREGCKNRGAGVNCQKC